MSAAEETVQGAGAPEPGRSWFPHVPVPSARRERQHALAEQVRALAATVLRLDVEAADERSLDQAEDVLAAAARLVSGLPGFPGNAGAGGGLGGLFERSPLSGRSNALAAPLTMWQDGEQTLARATYGGAYEGPPGCLHGGMVMAAFDDVLGVAQAASGTAGMTGTLSVRMIRPTPLHVPIDYVAGVTSRAGRKIEVSGRSTHRGTLLAEAQAVFVTPRPGTFPPPH